MTKISICHLLSNYLKKDYKVVIDTQNEKAIEFEFFIREKSDAVIMDFNLGKPPVWR